MIFKVMTKMIIQYPICIIILLLIYLIRPLVLIRIGLLSSWRMGHLAHDLEIYLANKNFSKIKTIDFISNTHLISNKFLKKKWEKKVKFINSSFAFPIIKLNRLFSKLFKKFEIHELVFHPYDGNGLVENSEINIVLSKKEIQKGWEILKKIGISKESKIVCLDVRDNAYLSQKFPKKNFLHHNMRNCDIQKFIPLTKFLNEKGYHVLRMGRIVEYKMNYQNSKYFEYCSSDIQSDFLDVFIASVCDFVINTATGWAAIPTFNFRKPAIYCNCQSILELLTHSKKIMLSTKVYFSKKLNRNLNLIEIMQNYSFVDGDKEKLNDLNLIEHDENQLLLIVKEFLKKKELNFNYEEDVEIEKINNKYWKIYSEQLEILKTKYSHKFVHKNHGKFLSNISIEFIKNNKFLIQE